MATTTNMTAVEEIVVNLLRKRQKRKRGCKTAVVCEAIEYTAMYGRRYLIKFKFVFFASYPSSSSLAMSHSCLSKTIV